MTKPRNSHSLTLRTGIYVMRLRVLPLPVDWQGRVQAGSRPRIDGPTIVRLRAGQGDTGAGIEVPDELLRNQALGPRHRMAGAHGRVRERLLRGYDRRGRRAEGQFGARQLEYGATAAGREVAAASIA